MRKLLATLMVLVLVLSLIVSAGDIDNVNAKASKDEKIAKQTALLDKLMAKSGDKFAVNFSKENGNPRFISGNLSDNPVKTAEEAAQYLDSNKDLFRINTGNFEIKKVDKDEICMTHYRTAYTVDGIPVYGGELILHTDKDGNVNVINGLIDSSIPAKAWKNEMKLNAEKAIKAAEATLGCTPTYTAKPETENYLYKANDEWQVVYLVTLHFLQPYPANMKIFVNAANGEVVHSYNGIKYNAATGTGISVMGQNRNLNLDLTNGTYYMKDLTKSTLILTNTAGYKEVTPGTLVSDTDNVFDAADQKAAVDAHYNMGKTYDFYKNNFNRNSYDNAGTTLTSVVHYGSKFVNAFWDGTQMVFGDGDGVDYREFSCSLDVIAHEFTHAVQDRTCGLVYELQPGALSESISDVFGYLVEGDANDWLIGEDLCITGNAIRNMADPTAYGDPAHMDDFQIWPNNYDSDNGGVHVNANIPNKAFYLAATQINDNAKMAQIYYRAITTYLTATSQFVDARNALIQSASDLYGSATASIIAQAFTSVGIVPYADTYEPNNATSQAYQVNSGTTYESYIASATDLDFYKFTTSSTGLISISLTKVPADYDIKLIDSTGKELASSSQYGFKDESINYNATAAGTYYVKVFGYQGAYNTNIRPYKLCVTYPSGGTTPPPNPDPNLQWYYETKTYDSPHNYTDNYNGTNTYTKTGASKVMVHFSQFETEKGYDYVHIKDKNGNTVASYDGTLSAFWATVDGDTININLVSDYSITKYGYHIDQVAYYANGQLIVQNVSINAAQ